MKRKRGYDIDDPRSSYHHTHYGRRGRGRGRGRGHGRGRGRGRYHSSMNNELDDPIDREQERMSRIRQLLVRIGERSSSTLAHNLDQLSTALLVDIEHYRTFIISTLFECVVHLATKIPIYATLIGLINNVKEDFGAEIVSKLSNEIIVSLTIQEDNNNNDHKSTANKSVIAIADRAKKPILDFNRIRLLCRFAVCLFNTNLIQWTDILHLIECLTKTTTAQLHHHIKEHVIYIIITSLIWCKKEKETEKENELEDIFKIIDTYIKNRNHIKNPLAFKPFKNVEIDLLSDIWNSFTLMYNNDNTAFEIKSIHSPQREFSRLKKKYKHPLTIDKNEIESIIMESWKNIDISKMDHLYPIWLDFGIPNLLRNKDADNKDTDNKEKMEQYVVMDYIHDIIQYFNQDTKLCAEQLINIPSSFESKFIIVEGIIFKMLMIPHAKHHFIFFGKIIIELFRKQTKVWPRVVGPIINVMFHCIDNIDIECRDRLIDWFSYHLANFNFQWPWENWSNLTAFPASAPQTAFITAVMNKCVHLSYYDRFKKTLPNEIISIVPPKPDANYKYGTDSICMNLLRMLNQRQSADDIANHLETYIGSEGEDSHSIIAQQIKILFTCILHVGKSSCSHVLSFLKMYGKKPLKELMSQLNSDDNDYILLKCLFDYWLYSPIRIEMLSDKLHACNYITPQTMIKFIFLKENIPKLYQQIYWIVVRQSMDRIVKTTQGMKRGIDKFVADIQELDKNLNSDFNDQEITTVAKQNKEKQLNQLQNRLQQTHEKIGNVFLLFFKQSLEAMYYLIDKMDEKDAKQEEEEEEVEEKNNEDVVVDDDDNEMDDDMLMSEQFIHKQEKIDKEKEKLAILKSRESNVNEYLFNIISERMIEIARRFYQNIDDKTWNELQNVVFADIKEKDDKYHKQIVHSVEAIFEIKKLLL